MGKVFLPTNPEGKYYCNHHDLAPLTATAIPRSVLRLSSCGITLVGPILEHALHWHCIAVLVKDAAMKCQNRGHRCIGAVLQ